MKPWARKFYLSREWKKTREAYTRLRHGLCERCGAGGKIVHHKIYLTPENIHDPAVTLNFENLELLCQECHNREHHETVPAADGLRFTADGDLVESPGQAPRSEFVAGLPEDRRGPGQKTQESNQE